ncbi:hypothetical protein GJ496_007051 [Pomphorhynchus laevis]|nr:hypothetical protein GJ496_007050 [Pomphorhynchus laevis]KAI0989452.1 hypothetical protein GJ496_007051 [Pomphorhynchus laevis]
MALLAHTKFARDLLGIKSFLGISPADHLDPFYSMADSSLICSGDKLLDDKLIFIKPSKHPDNNPNTLFYQTTLNLFGFQAQDIKLKLTKSYMYIHASRKHEPEKNNYLKLEYNRKLKIPKNVSISNALIYFTRDQHLVIKLPVDNGVGQGIDYPVSFFNITAFHKRLNKVIRSRVLSDVRKNTNGDGIDESHSTISVTLNIPENMKDNISVLMDKNTLIIKGTSDQKHEKKKSNGNCYSDYYRSMKLPSFIDCSKFKWNRVGENLIITLQMKDSNKTTLPLQQQ